jgi:hypothetical protein
VAFDRAPHGGVVEAQCLGYGRRVVLPATCRVRHVGEQEGDRSRWEPAAHARTVTRRHPERGSCTAAGVPQSPILSGLCPERAGPRLPVPAPSPSLPSFCGVFGTRIRPRFGLNAALFQVSSDVRTPGLLGDRDRLLSAGHGPSSAPGDAAEGLLTWRAPAPGASTAERSCRRTRSS